MKRSRERRGQFVIIAVMLTAIMIVSIGSLMHNAITYYKHEPWEEYSTVIGDIEINSRKIVELSLASYTNSIAQNTILYSNVNTWQNDLKDIYPSIGIVLKSENSSHKLENNVRSGLATTSMAKATFTLDIQSIGLKGYVFNVVTSLTVKISVTPINSTANEIIAVVKSETGMPVTDLNEDNFRIENATNVSVSPIYDRTNVLEYKIVYDGPTSAIVEVWDQRGIRVVCSQL